jgi:hypothetical protein
MYFTVFFDPPYWVGVLEEQRGDLLFAARYIFGAEPSDQEVYQLILRDLDSLRARMITGLPVEDSPAQKRINPKRALREARRTLEQSGVSTKAQEVMRLQLEQNKQERKVTSREDREAREDHKREVARRKKQQKHRGR